MRRSDKQLSTAQLTLHLHLMHGMLPFFLFGVSARRLVMNRHRYEGYQAQLQLR